MLEVEDEDAADGWFEEVGGSGVPELPTAPDTVEEEPFLGVC